MTSQNVVNDINETLIPDYVFMMSQCSYSVTKFFTMSHNVLTMSHNVLMMSHNVPTVSNNVLAMSYNVLMMSNNVVNDDIQCCQ